MHWPRLIIDHSLRSITFFFYLELSLYSSVFVLLFITVDFERKGAQEARTHDNRKKKEIDAAEFFAGTMKNKERKWDP